MGHLTNRQYRIPRKQAIGISDKIEQWHGIAQFSGEFKIPEYVEEAVEGLPVYTDSVKCELDKGQYAYICYNMDIIKEHWQKIYGHSVGQKRGRLGILKKEDIDCQILQNCR